VPFVPDVNPVLLPHRERVATEIVVRVGFAVGVQGRVRVETKATASRRAEGGTVVSVGFERKRVERVMVVIVVVGRTTRNYP
jgi:hypothetical protein